MSDPPLPPERLLPADAPAAALSLTLHAGVNLPICVWLLWFNWSKWRAAARATAAPSIILRSLLGVASMIAIVGVLDTAATAMYPGQCPYDYTRPRAAAHAPCAALQLFMLTAHLKVATAAAYVACTLHRFRPVLRMAWPRFPTRALTVLVGVIAALRIINDVAEQLWTAYVDPDTLPPFQHFLYRVVHACYTPTLFGLYGCYAALDIGMMMAALYVVRRAQGRVLGLMGAGTSAGIKRLRAEIRSLRVLALFVALAVAVFATYVWVDSNTHPWIASQPTLLRYSIDAVLLKLYYACAVRVLLGIKDVTQARQSHIASRAQAGNAAAAASVLTDQTAHQDTHKNHPVAPPLPELKMIVVVDPQHPRRSGAPATPTTPIATSP